MRIEKYKLKSNGYFSIIKEPYDKKTTHKPARRSR